MDLIANKTHFLQIDDCLCFSPSAAKVSNVFSHPSKVQSFLFILKLVILSLKTLLYLVVPVWEKDMIQ